MKRNLQSARWIGLVLCASLGSLWVSESRAAPLLLRGTARVATVYDNFAYEGTVRRLPFVASVGDTFPFFLSIESQQPAPDQPSGFATFRSSIGGVQLQHSQLEVLVANDSDVNAFFFAEPVVADVIAIVGDGILLRKPGQFGESDYAGTANVANAPGFSLEMGFLEAVAKNLPAGTPQHNYPTLLNETPVPQSAATWQAFSAREIAIRFENLSYVGAYIETVSIVPEPTAMSLLGSYGLCWLGSRFARRRLANLRDITSE